MDKIKPVDVSAGIFLVIVLLMMANQLFSSDLSSADIKNAPMVTPNTLYNDNGALIGKPVKFVGEVIQSSNGVYRISG